jgi:ribosomal protein S18 acetylase RimI-like enzyme
LAILIRAATMADLPVIVEFNQRLAEESEGKRLDSSVIQRGVARALQSPDLCRYFVAEYQGQVIGQTMVTFEVTDWRDGLAYWIQSVYVHRDHRRSGVFRRLYQHVLEEARQAGDVRIVRLYVEKSNDGAQAVYRRLGMAKTDYDLYEVTVQKSQD